MPPMIDPSGNSTTAPQSGSQEGAGDTPDVALAIPCYNEESVLGTTVTQLLAAFRERHVRVELVLVDNGSMDGTGRIIDEFVAAGAPVVKRRIDVNRGYGNGILQGLAACRGRIIGFVHADGQCEAADVVKICELALSSPTPVFVKVRRRFRLDGLRRKIISIVYNALANILYPGIGSLDVNGSPKVFPREYFPRMNIRSTDWFIDPEIMLRARELKLPVIERNVMAQMRTGGRSHVTVHTCKEFVVNLLRYRVGIWKPATSERDTDHAMSAAGRPSGAARASSPTG
ncbi:MAG: glycosyltransferase family 2 protein [Pirellulales bacterium]|nr:glycosyltransferase family 2 protein [Pirellulales bacterium]